MAIPSDIPQTVEKFMIYFFYVVGTISLVVNSTTLMIIIRKSSALTREIKFLTVFQQLSCLLSNAFLTLLFIPFFYLRMGGGYCMGALCMLVPYQYVMVVQLFLTICMISAFGMMIIAREQMLIFDNSIFKMKTCVRYAFYFIIFGVMHLWTVSAIVALRSKRHKQNMVLDEYPQIHWRERGLNWFLFYGPDNMLLKDLSYNGAFVQIPVFLLLVVLPFAHMLTIVMRARNKLQSQRNREVHFRNAVTIIIQFAILLIFILVPFIPATITTLQDDAYRGTQTAVVAAECIFVCSTLLNSIVMVSRNRTYLSSLSFLSRTLPAQRHSIQSISSVVA